MAVERIKVELNLYGRLEILRREREDRAEELQAIEAAIKEKAAVLETRRYLESLSPYYAMQQQEGLPTAEELEKLEEQRRMLIDLLETIDKELPAIDAQIAQQGGEAPAPSPPPPSNASQGEARKARFDF